MTTFYISNATDAADLIGKFQLVKIKESDLSTTVKVVHVLGPVALAFRDGGKVTFRGFSTATPSVATTVIGLLRGTTTLHCPGGPTLKRHPDFVPILHPNDGFTVHDALLGLDR